MRLYQKVQVLKLLNQHLGVYPTPMNLNWNWSWGSLSGLLLASQIVTGILLAMHYVGHVDHAFASVQHLMVDVPSGVIIRYAHANGASLFFTVVYLHVLRGLYYSSGTQPREILWISGVIILLLMIITAFIGYCYSQKWIFNVLIEDYTFFLMLETPITNSPPMSITLFKKAPHTQLLLGELGMGGFPLIDIGGTGVGQPVLSSKHWLADPYRNGGFNGLAGWCQLWVQSLQPGDKDCPYLLTYTGYDFECIGLGPMNLQGIEAPIPISYGNGGLSHLLLQCQIILNSKDGVKLSITPVNSYDNVHLKETQYTILKDNKQKSAVYLIYNKINGNSYIGSAISNRINVRFRNHCIHYSGGNKPLTRAIHKYGLDNFSFHILEYFNGFVQKENFNKNHIQLLELESSYLSKYKPIYNILPTAGSSIGLKHTEETKNKMKSNYSDERRELIGNLNKGPASQYLVLSTGWPTPAPPMSITLFKVIDIGGELGKKLSDLTKKLQSESKIELFKNENFKAQFLLNVKHTLFPKKKVFLYDPKGVLISEYESVNMVSQVFSCDRKTVRKYLDNPIKMFKNIGYLKTKQI